MRIKNQPLIILISLIHSGSRVKVETALSVKGIHKHPIIKYITAIFKEPQTGLKVCLDMEFLCLFL
ncbi:hypothetical protein D3C78_947020 [compost metagenome]